MYHCRCEDPLIGNEQEEEDLEEEEDYDEEEEQDPEDEDEDDEDMGAADDSDDPTFFPSEDDLSDEEYTLVHEPLLKSDR